MAPLTPAVSVLKGSTFQLLSHSVGISGSYLLSWIVMLGNMLWQYVNYVNCMVFGEEGKREGVWPLLGALRTHMMYGLRRDKHVHVVSRHVHCRSHVGTMMAWGWVAWLPALIRVKNLVCLLDCSVSAI